MEFRAAVTGDAEEVYEVQAQSCREAYAEILDDKSLIESMEDPSMIDHIGEWLEYTADDDRAIYPVAIDNTNGIVIGFAQLLVGEHAPDRTAPDEGFLQSLYVRPDYWGQGVGSELLKRSLEQLPEHVSTVSLEVLLNNDIGISFYEKHGFERVDTGEFEAGGTAYETTIYVRQVTK